MPNVIHLHPEPADSGPIPFLEAIDRSLDQYSSLTRFAPHVENFLGSICEENWFPVFSRAYRILARINWREFREDRPTSLEAAVRPDRHRDGAIEALADTFLQAYEHQESLRENAAKRGLGYFPPAYAYLDAFDSLFGNDSPVDYINEALQILSPEEPYAHTDDCWFADRERCVLERPQLEFFIKELLVPLMLRNTTLNRPAQGIDREEKHRQLGRMLLVVAAQGIRGLIFSKGLLGQFLAALAASGTKSPE